MDLGESIGRLARMDAMQQQQMNLNAKRQVEVSLAQVAQALDRLEQGLYGVCARCEDEIDQKRLQAKPETQFCVQCQV